MEEGSVEYELKLDVQCSGSGRAPTVRECLDVLVGAPHERFTLTPQGCVRLATHYFFGSADAEMLVVMDRGDGLWVKEKGPQQSIATSDPTAALVMCRTETQYQAPLSTILERVAHAYGAGATYQGNLVKDTVDAHVHDMATGHTYVLSVMHAKRADGAVQRQVEIEYEGAPPTDTTQLALDLATIGTWVAQCLERSSLCDHKLHVQPTSERKYDFVRES